MKKILVLLTVVLSFKSLNVQAATCYEVKKEKEIMTYIDDGETISFKPVMAYLVPVRLKLEEGDGTVTQFHRMKLRSGQYQGSDAILTNGEAELYIHQDYNPKTNLGFGEEVTFYPDGREGYSYEGGTNFFCPRMNNIR